MCDIKRFERDTKGTVEKACITLENRKLKRNCYRKEARLCHIFNRHTLTEHSAKSYTLPKQLARISRYSRKGYRSPTS